MLLKARREANLRRDAFVRPTAAPGKTPGVEPVAALERLSGARWPMVSRKAVNGSRLPAAKVLEGPLQWLSEAARDVERVTDGKYVLLVHGTRVEMNATLGMEAGGEIILGF